MEFPLSFCYHDNKIIGNFRVSGRLLNYDVNGIIVFSYNVPETETNSSFFNGCTVSPCLSAIGQVYLQNFHGVFPTI